MTKASLERTGPMEHMPSDEWEPPGWDPEHWRMVYGRWEKTAINRSAIRTGKSFRWPSCRQKHEV